MKKFYIKKIPVMKIFCIVLFTILVFLFIKDAAPAIGEMFNELSGKLSNSKQQVSARKMDAIKYKSIASVRDADRVVLDNAIIKIAQDLKENNKFPTDYDNIDGFYDLQSYFLEYKLYTISKVKVQNIFDKMPEVANSTRNLSDEVLKQYFNTNSENIEKTFGVTDSSDFILLVKNIRRVDFSKDLKLEFNGNGIYHNVKEKTIYITAYIDDVIFNFTFKPYKTTAAQTAPYVSVFGVEGGMS